MNCGRWARWARKRGSRNTGPMDRPPDRILDAEVGRRIREAFDRGRRRAIAQAKARAATLARTVLQLAAEDAARGRPKRGRAGRIHRPLAASSAANCNTV